MPDPCLSLILLIDSRLLGLEWFLDLINMGMTYLADPSKHGSDMFVIPKDVGLK
jgi:hypothetical protein